MKSEIDINNWNRKDHFLFFSQFKEPFFGVTINIDCAEAYKHAKEKGQSFFLFYLYRALKAVNNIEAFKYRIQDKKVFLFDTVNASCTINRPDETFGFAYLDYDADERVFYKNAIQVIDQVKQEKGLKPAVSGENIIHFSAVPWLSFTSLSHARSYSFADSIPKISFGKITDQNNRKMMPVSIHAHHGLMDGYHVGLFAEQFQELMNKRNRPIVTKMLQT